MSAWWRSAALYRAIFQAHNWLRLATARLRCWSLILRGMQGGGKCLIFGRVRVDRPWRVRVGARTQIEQDVWLKLVKDDARLEIGAFCYVGRGSELDISDSISIGTRVLIAPNVFITDHEHNIHAGIPIDLQGCRSAPVVIEDNVWLGAGSIVLPGVRIGQGAVVGAGAVVTRSIPKNAVVAGVPAVIRRLRT